MDQETKCFNAVTVAAVVLGVVSYVVIVTTYYSTTSCISPPPPTPLPTNQTMRLCAGEARFIMCDSRKVIHIKDAFLGRNQLFSQVCPFWTSHAKDPDCWVKKDLPKCEDAPKCLVELSVSDLLYWCNKAQGYMEVNYTCG